MPLTPPAGRQHTVNVLILVLGFALMTLVNDCYVDRDKADYRAQLTAEHRYTQSMLRQLLQEKGLPADRPATQP